MTIENTHVTWLRTNAAGLFWSFTGEIGDAIGICGGDSSQTRNGEDWVYGSFIMQHKDFPFLQCEIKYCYSSEQEMSYCQNTDREWLPLPAGWFAVISEHSSPIRSEWAKNA